MSTMNRTLKRQACKQRCSGPTDLSKCLLCGQGHNLDDCQDFYKKPFSERRDLFFCEKLCMGYAVSKSQLKDCKERSKCKTCLGMHPTCLYKEQAQVNDVVSNCVSVCVLPDQGSGFDHTLIVPVWVRPVGHLEKEILQYAESQRHSETTKVQSRYQLHWCLRLAQNSIIRDERRPRPTVSVEK